MLHVLGERNFRLFFLGYASSLIGSSMVPVALTFAVIEKLHRTSDVGYVLAAETIPLVAFILIGGVVADRVPRKLSMASADVLRTASQGILAALLLTGTPPLWAYLVLSGIVGAGQAFFNPAMTGLFPEMVSPEGLQSANALRGIADSGGQVIGPAVAGVLVAFAGAGWAIGIDAASYAASAACLLALRIAPRPPVPATSMLRQLAEGWTEFRSRTWVWLIVVQFATFNALSFAPVMVLGPILAARRLGGATAWGAILSAFGVGAVLGGFAAARLRPRRPLVVATMGAAVFALPLSLLAVPVATPFIAVGSGIAGVGIAVFGTFWETSLQREIPNAALSRVSSYDWFGSLAFVPVGYAIAGPLAGAFGIRDVLAFGAAWAVATCGGVLCSRSIRDLTFAGRHDGP